jgi:hypothetical protein
LGWFGVLHGRIKQHQLHPHIASVLHSGTFKFVALCAYWVFKSTTLGFVDSVSEGTTKLH